MSAAEPPLFDQSVSDMLHRGGLEAVRHGFKPDHLSDYNDQFLLQILTLSSFASVVGWQIYQRNPVIYQRHPNENDGKSRFLGCRTEWLQEGDVQRLSSPVSSLQYLNRLAPTLQFQVLELEPTWVQTKLSNVHAVFIPPFVESNSVGLDGISVEVRYGGYVAETGLRWWGDGPDEWKPLTKIIFAMLEELEDISA